MNRNLLTWARGIEKRAEDLRGDVYSGNPRLYPDRPRANIGLTLLGGLGGLSLGVAGGKALGESLFDSGDDGVMKGILLAGLLGLGGAGLGAWGGYKLSNDVADWRQEVAVKDEVAREALRERLRREMRNKKREE